MHLASMLASIGRTLSRNRVRALLMMGGVTVGIASLITVSSIGESAQRETMKRIRNMLGTFDTVIVRPGSGKDRGMVSLANAVPTLKFIDADAMAQVPGVRRVAELQDAFDVDVTYGDKTRTPAIFGVSPNWPDLRGDEVAEGSFVTEEENRAMAKVAVLGPDAQKELFGADDPIGKNIRIGDVPFTVIGTLAPRGAGPGGASLDNLVLIPVNTASKRLFNRDFLTMVVVQIADPGHPDVAIRDLRNLLRERHRLPKDALDDFTMTSPAAIMAQITAVGASFRRLLLILSALATGIGGVVILSVTLIGVAERKREIGVRRAVGAPRSAVLVQFLCEALALSVTGGALGLAIGIAGTQAVSRWQHLPFLINVQSVISAMAISIGLGLAAGIYPAWRAARTDAVEALRS
jgi:putative ABC transport system permease protein